VKELEPALKKALQPLEEHELVGEVRTIGLLGGVELVSDALANRPDLLDRVVENALQRGVIVRALRGAVLQISPPFVVSADQLATIAAVVRESLNAVV
jgi:adenosylmethionine-8-amino-7-oxononanoate aminotransferase